MSALRTPQLVVIIGNVRRAGPDGCTLEWLARRVNIDRLSIERALANQIKSGLMTEEHGVYKLAKGLPA
ncbi:MAG: hypothetical protein AB9900_12560 [Humidesulfovibrio sp.]